MLSDSKLMLTSHSPALSIRLALHRTSVQYRMSRTVELPTPLQLKTFRPVSCPIGHVSLAPWVSSDDNSPYIHPMYQSKPMIDRYPAVLSIPTDWRGGYWDQRQNRVPTEEDVQAVLRSQGEGAVIGGPAFWYPAHWSLRVLAHHSLLCPTVHPANARHIPILQRVSASRTHRIAPSV